MGQCRMTPNPNPDYVPPFLKKPDTIKAEDVRAAKMDLSSVAASVRRATDALKEVTEYLKEVSE